MILNDFQLDKYDAWFFSFWHFLRLLYFIGSVQHSFNILRLALHFLLDSLTRPSSNRVSDALLRTLLSMRTTHVVQPFLSKIWAHRQLMSAASASVGTSLTKYVPWERRWWKKVQHHLSAVFVQPVSQIRVFPQQLIICNRTRTVPLFIPLPTFRPTPRSSV